MADGSEQRTEQPTPRRRLEARQQGRVARSRDLVSALVLASVVGWLWFSGQALASRLQTQLAHGIRSAMVAPPPDTSTAEFLLEQCSRAILTGLLLAAGCALAAVVSAVLANWLQFGFLLTPQALRPDPTRLSPVAGLARVFGGGLLRRATGVVVKVLLVGGLSGWLLFGFVEVWCQPLWIGSGADFEAIGQSGLTEELSTSGLRTQLARLTGPGLEVLGLAVSGLLAIGVVDHLSARWRLERSLRMTPQELREERESSEPSAMTRREQKSRRAAMAPQAGRPPLQPNELPMLVMTDGDGRAVGIRYDERNMTTPEIVRWPSAGFTHLERQRCVEADVPVVVDAELTRELWELSGDQLPLHRFHAVARWLSTTSQGATSTNLSTTDDRQP